NQHLWSSPASRDGVILPLGSDPIKIRPRLIDPIATPGIGSLPHHPPRPSSNRQDFLPSAGAAGVVPAGAAPAQIKLDIDVSALDVPNVGSLDSYSLRLIAPRRLYDRGTQVAGSEHLSGLAQPGTLHLNHYDLDRMGVSTGDTVRVVSSTGGYQIVVETDDEVPRGVALIGFNLNSSGCRASQLVDMSRPVTDLRLEAL
ncbi:MAG TPA: molybdopterin dinucleotide binding domain-containing protein, partial [Acidimicrobiales bacterium]|nr:molybdopterin dinucleotide binding domain-containing protein [Acidimicrobiales bacterium]